MTRALAHRGPDGEGYYRGARIALGHRRLSIVDIEGGRQPITNEDDSLVLVCNGEIYNSPSLRAELLRRGHRFRTATDVEVILHLYEEHGLSCVSMLRGMFAFAVWDVRTRTLVLARDHMGQKPLFYAETHGAFAFASEPKGVLASGLVEREIDLDGLWHYVSLRYLPDRRTLFRGVRKLPAGSTLTWRDGHVETNVYWSLDFRRKTALSEDAIVEELDSDPSMQKKVHVIKVENRDPQEVVEELQIIIATDTGSGTLNNNRNTTRQTGSQLNSRQQNNLQNQRNNQGSFGSGNRQFGNN